MAESIPTADLKTYKGNCHCGAFKFTVEVPELTSVVECNCSICFRKGYKWVFPGAGCFTIEKGDGSLKDYEFGKHSMSHKFCPTCGTAIMGKRHGMAPGMDIGINARTLQDIDLWSLKVNKYDGAALEPAYKAHAFTGPLPTAEIENSKLYTGSCHCGAATIALMTKGLLSEKEEGIPIVEGNCSICARLGRINTSRPPTQVSISLAPGIKSLSSYSLPLKLCVNKFCPVCGVHVCVDDIKIPSVEGQIAVNLRCLEEVEWDAIETFKGECKKFGGEYVVPE